jgi:hypothetical protein
MVLFVIFCPIIAAILIMVGAPARKTALAASILTFAVALFLLISFILFLRISRASANSHIFINWNLGKRKPGRGSVENYDLSGDRKFYFAARPDPAVSKRSANITQL